MSHADLPIDDQPRLKFLFRKLSEFHADRERMRILDVGNLEARGKIHTLLGELFPPAELNGLDTVDQSSLGLSFPHQTIGSFEEMPYPDNFFDVVYIGEVIEHTWVPKQVIERCHAVLKDGGHLILDTPNIYSLSRMIRYMLTGKDIILGNPDHKLFFSRAMLEHLLQSSGFRIIELTTETNFVTRRAKFRLPHVGTFPYMGECLMVLARKTTC